MSSIAAKRKLLVSDVMTTDPITLPSGATVAEAARLMREHNIGNVLVVDDSLLTGILTDRDIVTRVVGVGGNPDQITVGEAATNGPKCARSDEHAFDAVKKMRSAAVTRLPVVDHGRVLGIISIGDLAMKLEDRTTLAAVFAGHHADDE
jgi:CBS domain-containing protein